MFTVSPPFPGPVLVLETRPAQWRLSPLLDRVSTASNRPLPHNTGRQMVALVRGSRL